MPIENIKQPKFIKVDEKLRLSAYNGEFDFAFDWYQDMESLRLIDGEDAIPYSFEKLKRMYEYLNNIGELYFIEILSNNRYIPVGDITFLKEDMPVVLAKDFRNLGIGKKVIKKLIERGIELGYSELNVKEIFHYNIGSKKLFKSCGFVESEIRKNGSSYKLYIK